MNDYYLPPKNPLDVRILPMDKPGDPHLRWEIGDVLYHTGLKKLVRFDGWHIKDTIGIKHLCWAWEEEGVHQGPKRFLTTKDLMRDADPLELLSAIDRTESRYGVLRALRRWKKRADNDLEGTYNSLKHRLDVKLGRFL